MPGGEEHVVDCLSVKVRLGSITHERFGGMFGADAQVVGGRQRLGDQVGARFAEGIRPEKIVARVIQFHSGEESIGAIEIFDHIGKSPVVIPVEGPVIAALEIIDIGFAGLPTGGGSEDQGWPCHID